MSGPNGMIQTTETAGVPTSFSSTDSPIQTSGTVQCGAWNAGAMLGTYGILVECIEGVPSECRCFISGPNVQRISGSLQQSSLFVSITAGTVQLTANVSDALNGQRSAPSNPVQWKSSNEFVATVDSTGLVTLVGKGQCEIELRYSRGVVRQTATTTPSPTEAQAVYATLVLQVGA